MTEPLLLPSARRWPVLLLGVALGVAAAAAMTTFMDLDKENTAAAVTADPTLSHAPVEIRDLVEEVEWVADLVYGTAVDVAAPAAGTVTATSDVGAVLRRGDVVVAIDGVPVTVLYGQVPAWRDLAEDDEGPDVLQLESNLVALGFDPDGNVTVDEQFDAHTEDMVEAWQESLGVEVTGVFTTGLAVVVDGPVAVVTAPAVGAPTKTDEPLAQVSARSIVTDVVPEAVGVVAAQAPVGTLLEHGTLLLTIDETEVRAVTALAPIDGISLDDGVAREFVLVTEGQQVGAWLVEEGAVFDQARPVLELSQQTLSVIVPVGLADQDDWVVAQPVEILLPDDSVVAGLVTSVGTVAQGTGQGQTPTIDVTVQVLDLLADDLPASEVTVIVAGDSVMGATVVPTRALVTLAEGGFAVERIAADGNPELVGVVTGTFDDGVVEVIDSDLVAGDMLVVPS